MSNSFELIPDWRMQNIWTLISGRGRGEGKSGASKSPSSLVPAKELYWQAEETFKIQCWWSCLFTSFTNSRHSTLRSQRKVSTSLRRTIWDHWRMWSSGLSTATSFAIRSHPWCFPHIPTQEMCPSSDQNHQSIGNLGGTWSLLCWISTSNLGSKRKRYSSKGGKNVQNSVVTSY